MYYEKYEIEIESTYTERNLLAKIKNKMRSVQIIIMRNKKIFAPAGEFEVDLSTFNEMIADDFADKLAIKLRTELSLASVQKLPPSIKVDDLIAGECEVPAKVLKFVKTIICGAMVENETDSNCTTKVNSICEDMLYATRHGTVKTSKHMCLGILLKSITSSRKVIDILNKFGHCCSYNIIEALETEAAYSASSRGTLCLGGVRKGMMFFTSLAFDNFDRYVETSNGKNTLHDTVGILMQNILSCEDLNFDFEDSFDAAVDYDAGCESNDFDISEQQARKRMRRTYHEVVALLCKYTKTPKCFEKLLPLNDEKRSVIVPDEKFILQLNILWVLSHICSIKNSSLWTGFNSKVVVDNSPQQKLFY